MEIWSEEDEKQLQVRLKHLIKLLEFKHNKLSLNEYLKFLDETKNQFERDKYINALRELLQIE